MKYIFITYSGLGLPIAQKLLQEGQEVIVGHIENIKDYVIEEEIEKARENDVSKQKRLDLFKKVIEIQPADKVIEMMQKIKNTHEYFVFFDENNLYRWADKIRDLGFEGTFPTREDYFFEIDRDHAKQFVKEHYPKLHVPEVVEFTKASEGIEFMQSTNEIWVLKGKHDMTKAFIPDANDIEVAKMQIIEVLSNFPQKYEHLGYILEKFIPAIIELTPEKMYYDGVPLLTTVDIENKPFGSGNISIQTGCAEDLVFPISMEERINQLVFPPVIDEMARNHKGLFVWDASLLISKKDGKIYFGEFCSNRVGYNSFFTTLAQAPSVHGFFENLVHKHSPLPLGTVGASLRLFNLNRDYETEQISGDIAIDYKAEIEKDVWLWDAKKNQRGKLLSVGADWGLAIITGAGKSIDEAVTKLYKNVDQFSFVGVYYRSKDDYVSLDYSTSILNRLNYGLERGLYHLPFDVKVGEIKTK